MASIVKHGTGWRAEVYKNKQRASKKFDTKKEAKEWAAEKEHEFANVTKFVATRKRVADLFDRYAREVSVKKKGAQWESVRINKFKQLPMADLLVGDVSSDDILRWKEKRLEEVAASTVKREMNLLSAMFNHARKEWKWLKINPVSDVSRPKEPRPRNRRVNAEEIRQICAWFGFDGEVVETKEHQIAVMFLLALETAMRLGEIHGLDQSDLHLDKRYLKLPDSKNSDARDVPLTVEAVRLLRLLDDDLFTVRKGSVSTLFGRAVKQCGIKDLTFHDTRHEAITRLAQKLEILDLARMVGHRDPKNLMIYYNPTASEIANRLG